MASISTNVQPGQVVCPGDVIAMLPEEATVHIGPGVLPVDDALLAVKGGTLQITKHGTLWVDTAQRRYAPAKGDPVVGVITERYAENYHVHIHAAFPAQLPALAFEGATRRNKPNLQVGDVVYARVETCHKDLDTVLTCMDPHGKASGFGPLTKGYTVHVDSAHARRLLAQPPAAVLSALGNALQFEVAVGLNGAVWVDAPSPGIIVLVAHALVNTAGMSDAQSTALVQQLLDKVQKGGG